MRYPSEVIKTPIFRLLLAIFCFMTKQSSFELNCYEIILPIGLRKQNGHEYLVAILFLYLASHFI